MLGCGVVCIVITLHLPVGIGPAEHSSSARWYWVVPVALGVGVSSARGCCEVFLFTGGRIPQTPSVYWGCTPNPAGGQCNQYLKVLITLGVVRGQGPLTVKHDPTLRWVSLTREFAVANSRNLT